MSRNGDSPQIMVGDLEGSTDGHRSTSSVQCLQHHNTERIGFDNVKIKFNCIANIFTFYIFLKIVADSLKLFENLVILEGGY